jgi:arabinofuranosyltransferase
VSDAAVTFLVIPRDRTRRARHHDGVPDQREIQRGLRGVQLLLLLLFTVLVMRHAWMMDDAYITLRSVDNLFAGHGPVWNPGERVQSYTHPLWMLICCGMYAVTREYFYSLFIVGALVSVGALAIVTLRLSRSQVLATSLLLAATLSHAFVDYSTSGLENPLTHLLLALLAWVYLGQLPDERRFKYLCLIGGLALLSRPDNGALFGPAVLAGAVQAYRRGTKLRALLRAALIGGIPLYAWEAFSLIYYGSLVPNTALAKLNSGIDGSELIEQGFFHIAATLDFDPLTLVVVLAGMVSPLLAKQWRLLPLSLGIALHLLYTIKIGGDFMLGRFFTAPMFMAMVCLSQLRRPGLLSVGIATAVLVALGLAAHPNTFEINTRLTEPHNKGRTWRGITDERTLLWDGNSLLKSGRIHELPHPRWWARAKPGAKVEVDGALGYRGLVNGPDVHWVDRTALSDPLLARLPALHRADWMSGHFFRAIPKGYVETLEGGENVIQDPAIHELYQRIDLVVRGDLFSLDRFAAIWWLNTGGPAELINEESWRFHGAAKLMPDSLSWRVDDGTRLDDKQRVHRLPLTGAYVKFKKLMHPQVLEISISGHDRFEIRFYDGREEVARVPVPRVYEREVNNVVARRIELPEALTERGFSRLRVVPLTKRQAKTPYYAIGHLLFDDEIDAARPVSERPPDPKLEAAEAKARAKAKPKAMPSPKRNPGVPLEPAEMAAEPEPEQVEPEQGEAEQGETGDL